MVPIILEIVFLMIFLFLGSSLAHLDPKLQMFEVWEMMVKQIIIAIAMVGSKALYPCKGRGDLVGFK